MLLFNGREIFQRKRADGKPDEDRQRKSQGDSGNRRVLIRILKALTAEVITERQGKRGVKLAGLKLLWNDGMLWSGAEPDLRKIG